MPPRNNRLPAPVEPPLPALVPYDENLPSIDPPPEFLEEMNNVPADDYAVPDEVYNDFASEPSAPAEELPQTGMGFDFNSLNVQTREDFDALPLEQQELLKAMKRGVQFTPAGAAEFVLKQQNARAEMERKTAMMQADPMRQAQLADRNAKLAEKKSVQTDFKVRRDNTLKTIDEILSDPDYKNLVGPVDGTFGRAYDAAFNEKMQAKRARLDRLVNIDVLDMTKYLRPISQDELKYLRGLVPGQRQHWEVYEQYLTEKRDMLKASERALVNPANNQALSNDEGQTQPAPAQNLYQQSQQNPAAQLRQQFEQSDELTLPNGQKLKRVVDANGNIGWEPQ